MNPLIFQGPFRSIQSIRLLGIAEIQQRGVRNNAAGVLLCMIN